jgi:hypothetical protein
MNMLADNAMLFFENEQLSKFLRHLVPQEESPEYSIPRFYGIPKIHKNPARMRPIVPCHAAMQNPAAKYVSKALKPVIEQLPYTIKGTKDMAIKLAKLQLNLRRRFFLVGFDLVAFYSNIDLNHCITACKNYYKDVCDPNINELVMMSHTLNVSFKNLIFEFDGQFYKQIKGIAMGVAASPDGANIYASVHEEVFLERDQLSDRRIPFYGRYIDDGFMIVYTDSADDALAYTKDLVTFTGLELTWEVSGRSLNFLDLMIYIDPITMSLQWKPFRKARNNLECIPFASHHPADIKRGTFLREMSRMAILCSSTANYLDMLNDLAKIYIARGYPPLLVRKWIKENSNKRWASCYSEKRESPRVGDLFASKLLILKTTFNLVWEAFNVHELSDVITKEWTRGIVAQRARWSRFWDSGITQPTLSALLPSGNTGSGAGVMAQVGDLPEAEGLAADVAQGGTPKVTDIWLHELGVLRGLNMLEVRKLLDVSKIGFINARWLVSRKKVRGLADILNKLKHETLDERLRLKDLHSLAVIHTPLDTESADGERFHFFADMDV